MRQLLCYLETQSFNMSNTTELVRLCQPQAKDVILFSLKVGWGTEYVKHSRTDVIYHRVSETLAAAGDVILFYLI